jgi:hypothetical protein
MNRVTAISAQPEILTAPVAPAGPDTWFAHSIFSTTDWIKRFADNVFQRRCDIWSRSRCAARRFLERFNSRTVLFSRGGC